MKCTCCGASIGSGQNWVAFDCPSCGRVKIIRCSKCKKMVNTYTCSSCKFVGP